MTQDPKETQETPVTPALRDPLAIPDHKAQQVTQDLLDLLETPDHKETQEILVILGHKVLPAIRDLRDRRATQVTQDQ